MVIYGTDGLITNGSYIGWALDVNATPIRAARAEVVIDPITSILSYNAIVYFTCQDQPELDDIWLLPWDKEKAVLTIGESSKELTRRDILNPLTNQVTPVAISNSYWDQAYKLGSTLFATTSL